MKNFTYYRNTKDRDADEQESEVIDKANDDFEAIDYQDFIKQVDGFDAIAKSLGYDADLPVQNDWSVSFGKSKYGGLPCLMFCHTECNFIFLHPDDAKMLAEAYASGKDPIQWIRTTSFGRGAALEKSIDPTHDKFAYDM